MRTLFLGMRGGFSRAALAELLAGGADVAAVLLPGEPGAGEDVDAPVRRLLPRAVARSTLPLLTPEFEPSIVSLAWERGIPALEVARERDSRTMAELAAYAPEVACVACWPRWLPLELLQLPPAGFLNLHPSLLPAHRGPAPLFWALRQGDGRVGVTVHQMDATLDGGDILTQEALDVPEGVGGAALEERCARVGGRLLVASLVALATGDARRTPQVAGEGSYEPWPGPDDFVVPPDRPARWAFNFLRGAGHWGGPLTIAVTDERFTVRAALDYTGEGTLGTAYRRRGSDMWLQCAPGILHALVD
jgi:methionyl-tRNA formyltransferase